MYIPVPRSREMVASFGSTLASTPSYRIRDREVRLILAPIYGTDILDTSSLANSLWAGRGCRIPLVVAFWRNGQRQCPLSIPQCPLSHHLHRGRRVGIFIWVGARYYFSVKMERAWLRPKSIVRQMPIYYWRILVTFCFRYFLFCMLRVPRRWRDAMEFTMGSRR
jgi:hypothetical protein